MMGWKCPGCGACYAPIITECRRCNAPVTSAASTDVMRCIHLRQRQDTSGRACMDCGEFLAPAFLGGGT